MDDAFSAFSSAVISLTIRPGKLMLNFDDFEVVTFDCYGTLIDWEAGLLNSLLPILSSHKVKIGKQELLTLYSELEAVEESGAYIAYKEVLKNVVKKIGSHLGFTPTSEELEYFPQSIEDWGPFPDTVDALKRLKNKYKLAVISNIDDDLFVHSAKHLQVEFDWVITAQQVKSYKPSLRNFHTAIERIGLPTAKILHTAQSLYHDISPAKSMGLSAVWINRRHDTKGFGATPPSVASPDLTFPDLKSFSDGAVAKR
jgi:2-haloacid dehalogenase